MLGGKFSGKFISTKAGANGKAADVVFNAAVHRRDKIGQAAIRRIVSKLQLLAQVIQAGFFSRSALIGVNNNIIARTIGRE